MTDDRSSSASSKRAEQLKRWEESDTNMQSPKPKSPSKIQFSPRVVFLAACADGEKDEVLKLLKEGTDINTVNEDGLTALHQACIDNDLKMVEFLVAHGADVNCRDKEGWTPLHATVSCGFLSIARYLMENGADVASVNNDGDLPVDITESKPISEFLSKIIDEKGIDCEQARNAERNNLLANAQHWAAHGYVEVRDSVTGATPLHVAAAKGFIDIAKILLEDCGVDPDAIDNEGWTPLHAACHWAEKEAVTLLIKYGANPHIKNFAGQNCADLVDSSMLPWMKEVMLKVPKQLNNNNNKRKGSPPKHDVKRVELITGGQTELNDKPQEVPEVTPKISENKPPKGRPPSPDASEPSDNPASQDDPPSWRRSVSFRYRPVETRDKKPASNAVDNETILRRTHSFENDKSFYQRYRDVTARIKASSCPSIPPPPLVELRKKDTNTSDTNDDVQNRINPSERKEKDAVTWNAQTTTTTNTNPTITTTQTTVRSSPENVESNTNSSNSTPSAATPTKLSPGNIFKNFFKSFVPPVRDEESETQRKAHAKRVRETRRSTQGVTLDEIKSAEQLVKKKSGNGNGTTDNDCSALKKSDESLSADTELCLFALEDAYRSSPRPVIANSADTTITLRRPPAGSTANTTTSNNNEDSRTGEEDKENNADNKNTSSTSPASTQVALSAVQRRRRPKRRCTGVGPIFIEDIACEPVKGGDGDGDDESNKSGTEREEDSAERDYKALYEASSNEVHRLRALLATSEQQLREARATIASLSQVNQSSLSEIEKREKRAMERKLSEMEEELKHLQKLKAENERLRAENRALTRVVSKLTNSAAK